MEKELETKTKRTRTNESSTYALTTGSNVLYETAPAKCLDLVHTEQQQAAAQQQMTEQMASGSDSVLWNEMVRIMEQEDVVKVIFHTATGKTITLDAKASDEGIGYSFVKGNKVVWRGMVHNCFDCDTFCDEVVEQVPKELNFHFEDEQTWLMYVNNITAADCESALLKKDDVIEFRFNDTLDIEASSTIEPDIHFKIE